jgi:DNA-directed RNA polymerase specialized sigma24 family protein
MPAPSEGSVTCWIHQLKAGDQAVVQNLWEGYYQRLVGLARAKLRGRPAGMADEEDVAVNAFDSFCRDVGANRFPKLRDRDDLWQLLEVVAARKVSNQIRHELRQKRGGGKVQNIAGLCSDDSSQVGAAFAGLISCEPDPAFAAVVADECRGRLEQLEDAEARSVALWKMEGFTNPEIAVKLGRSVPTVERRLRLIRSCWEKETTP